MDRSRHHAPTGFTLLELMIVLVLIGILVAIALPNLVGARITANETAAIATLRLLVVAEGHLAAAAAIDQNQNGIGEYATFGEISGGVPLRQVDGGTKLLAPSLVSRNLDRVSAVGEMERNGYLFRLYLPDANGDGLAELPGGGAPAGVDPNRAESLWCAYAWPMNFNSTGRRTFFVNQCGNIISTEDANYDGSGAPILPGAALVPPANANSIDGVAAVDEVARDGNTWHVIGN